MAWRKYMNGIVLGVVVFSISLILVVNFMSPESGYVSFAAFFISFFMLLTCLFTIIGFYGRRRLSNNEILYYNLKVAFRQGTLAALFFTMLLIMRAAGILNLWDGLLLAGVVILFDMFFKSKV